ncbi:MAG: hypothetical protein IT337_13920 [Thermomicrobiales bacterium]|nr:hypothetical protein [Thermomicrobiales bacterium]
MRSIDADALLERFFVAAASAFVGIRIYLALTGYPQIGGNGLHIAHLLWGGLAMLVGLVLMLAFLGRDVRWWAALIGGLGFGTFIDELGKLITSDVNYFFRPAISLIYATFVLLFVAFRLIVGRSLDTQRAALAEMFEILETGAIRGLRPEERELATNLLARIDPGDPLAGPLAAALADLATLPESAPGLFGRVEQRLKAWYARVRRSRGFLPAIIALVVVFGFTDAAQLISEVVSDPSYRPGSPAIGWTDGLKAIAVVTSGLLVTIGAVLLARSRLRGFKWMKAGVLVSLLLGQMLAFYTEQLLALWGLAFYLTALGALNFAIGRERDSVHAPAA